MKMERDVNRKGPAGELCRIHMRSKHSPGTQPMVNLLMEVTCINWVDSFQPPFSLFSFLFLEVGQNLMSSNKRGRSDWSKNRDLKPTLCSFPCPSSPTSFFQGTPDIKEHSLQSPKLDHFCPIRISWLPQVSPFQYANVFLIGKLDQKQERMPRQPGFGCEDCG